MEQSTNLGQPIFKLFASNLIGQAGATIFTDTNAIGTGSFFYRVAVGD